MKTLGEYEVFGITLNNRVVLGSIYRVTCTVPPGPLAFFIS